MTDRPDPPVQGDELAQLHGFLDFQRATLQWKAAGLDADGMRRTLPPSTLTLGGLLKHMALVEDNWFSYFLIGNERLQPWRDFDWDADPDWEFRTAADDDPDDLRALLDDQVARSRQLVAGLPADTLSVRRMRGDDETQATLRWIVLHMIEEYARHNGHADLIRESIDGQTGE
jgi:uncharacterized damage-inducible protein DinB